MRASRSLPIFLVLFLSTAVPLQAAEPARVYVLLWFDTEDYLLPASDDAALRLAEFLARAKIRATFKVVGEKARTLERRGRFDVIEALKKHEIGYHSNYHSTQPSPALYLSRLGWDEGVREFDRREKPGYDDVKRLFGQAPSCYGQPGSSWGPQSFGALKSWGVPVYLDAGSHVALDGKPHYYGGLLTLYKLTHTLRADLVQPKNLPEAEQRFAEARKQLLAEGGGVVSVYYHPCEFVHKQFWDGVNFKAGANPPRERWVQPPAKTEEESKAAYQVFENYVRFMSRFPDVQFITAREAAALYADAARGRKFTPAELKEVAAAVRDGVTHQVRSGYTLAPSEIFALLVHYVSAKSQGQPADAVELADTPFGPSAPGPLVNTPVTTDWSQFTRTAADAAAYVKAHGRVPTAVWLGSTPVPPEVYLTALARVTVDLVDGKEPPKEVALKPATLASATHVAEDGPNLWTWVIFPRDFRAPGMMQLGKRQAWTLKPAMLRTK